jgi:hypothetical protein
VCRNKRRSLSLANLSLWEKTAKMVGLYSSYFALLWKLWQLDSQAIAILEIEKENLSNIIRLLKCAKKVFGCCLTIINIER